MNGFQKFEKALIDHQEFYDKIKNSSMAEFITDVDISEACISFTIRVNTLPELLEAVRHAHINGFSEQSAVHHSTHDNTAHFTLYHGSDVFSYCWVTGPDFVMESMEWETHNNENR